MDELRALGGQAWPLLSPWGFWSWTWLPTGRPGSHTGHSRTQPGRGHRGQARSVSTLTSCFPARPVPTPPSLAHQLQRPPPQLPQSLCVLFSLSADTQEGPSLSGQVLRAAWQTGQQVSWPEAPESHALGTPCPEAQHWLPRTALQAALHSCLQECPQKTLGTRAPSPGQRSPPQKQPLPTGAQAGRPTICSWWPAALLCSRCVRACACVCTRVHVSSPGWVMAQNRRSVQTG